MCNQDTISYPFNLNIRSIGTADGTRCLGAHGRRSALPLRITPFLYFLVSPKYSLAAFFAVSNRVVGVDVIGAKSTHIT